MYFGECDTPRVGKPRAAEQKMNAKEDTVSGGKQLIRYLIRANVEGLTFVTQEDWALRWQLRQAIKREIKTVVQRMIETAEVQDPEIEDSSDTVVPKYSFSVKTWSAMIEDSRLPKHHLGRRIIYELEENRLKIRELASSAHDAAANALNFSFGFWCSNGGTNVETVRQLGQGSNSART